ncbi:4202_t:CDS:2 [Acaulospora colombiana]|uniref:4202_t:CDS:1 n=1 Tax=Acaulospora colombiana TaxID=27376 RepID=A0ACA9MJ23_9GLOM|nr:4202_t:CDS:2 [Acaulospora colombiana]
MQAYVDELPVVQPPDEVQEDGERMSEQYRKLSDAYKNYEQSRTEASTSSSVLELQAWHDSQPRAEYLRTLEPSKISTFFLPVSRRILIYRDKNHLEDHQQYKSSGRDFSEVATALVAQVGRVREQAHRFSSSDFISKAHEHQRFEAEHPSMEPVTYMDFFTVKPSSTVVLGTKRETEVLTRALKRIADGKVPVESSSVPDRKEALRLERRFQFVLLSSPPILHLTREEVTRGSRGMPRERMQPIMDRVPPEYRRLLGDVLIAYWSEESTRSTGEACLLLTHRPEDEVLHILRDIYNKWDFENNCALHKGVKRIWYRPLGKIWLVWERGKMRCAALKSMIQKLEIWAMNRRRYLPNNDPNGYEDHARLETLAN